MATAVMANSGCGMKCCCFSKPMIRHHNSQEQIRSSIVMVTHSPACAGYARQIMRVTDGRLVEEDSKLRSIEKWERNERRKEPLFSQGQNLVAGSHRIG